MLQFCHCGQIKGQCKCKPVTTKRQTTKERGYGHDWRLLSEQIRADNPLCYDCLSQGRTTPSTQVHHIVPVTSNADLRLDAGNLVPLCGECHEARHRSTQGAPFF